MTEDLDFDARCAYAAKLLVDGCYIPKGFFSPQGCSHEEYCAAVADIIKRVMAGELKPD